MKQPKDDHAGDAIIYHDAGIFADTYALVGHPPKLVYFATRIPTAAELNQERIGQDFDEAIDAILKERP